jgi:hypothetical protein
MKHLRKYNESTDEFKLETNIGDYHVKSDNSYSSSRLYFELYENDSKIGRIDIQKNTLEYFGYSKIRENNKELNLDKDIYHLNDIGINKEYRNRGLIKLFINTVMSKYKIDRLYLQPTSESISFWNHIGSIDTGYNYRDYDNIILMSYAIKIN